MPCPVPSARAVCGSRPGPAPRVAEAWPSPGERPPGTPRGLRPLRLRRGGLAAAGIGDLDGQAIPLVADDDLAGAGTGMLDHVGQCLLHDPERRLVDGGRDVPAVPGPGQVHPDARSRGGGHQALQVGQAGGGRELELPCRAGRLALVRPAAGRGGTGLAGAVLAEHAEQPLHVAERLPGDVLDVAKGGTCLGRVAVEDVLAEAGLHRDHRHAVRHHVVQFPGDPEPFLGHRGRGHLLAHPSGVGAALLHAEADHPGDDQDQRHAGGRARAVAGHAQDEPLDDEQCQGGGERGDRHRPGAGGRHREENERQGQERAAVDLTARRDDEGAADQRQQERAHGVAAPQPDGKRHDDGQQRMGPGTRKPEARREHVDSVVAGPVHDRVDEQRAHGRQCPVHPGPGTLLEPHAQRWAARLSAHPFTVTPGLPRRVMPRA